MSKLDTTLSFFSKYAALIVIPIIIIYMYLTRKFSKSVIKKNIKICLKILSKDLKKSLITKEENKFNCLLKDYLDNNSESSLSKLADHLSKKYHMSYFSSLTVQSVVMKFLMIEIINEQSELIYNNGYIFTKNEFINLEKVSPFVKNYCVIVEMDDHFYYTNFLMSSTNISLGDMIESSFSQMVELICKNDIRDYDKIIFPKNVVILISDTGLKYYIDFRNVDIHNIYTMMDGNYYGIKGIVLNIHNFFRNKCLAMDTEEFDRFKETGSYKKYATDFMGLLVLSRNINDEKK
ncbi:hypothetical protein TUBRATIS_000860 [Tubulinosema ratisbonensis]|uniref:Uncharacterized protein n=1 Tax=Tubulinosema ratisbonensis TaxID=291195 RepID=A0A437AQA5_9MICR|nr:hypothetical protein TUBRATIS_000860 [Tubulinosema ratisbonensis]